jgi:hypothetical protein
VPGDVPEARKPEDQMSSARILTPSSIDLPVAAIHPETQPTRRAGWLFRLLGSCRRRQPPAGCALRSSDLDAALLRDIGIETRHGYTWAATERDFFPLQP